MPRSRRNQRSATPKAKSVTLWVLGGFVGAAMGAVAWLLVAIAMEAEGRWIAWAVGLLAGVGVRYVAWRVDEEESFAQGVVAAGMALLAIFAAKLIIAWADTGREGEMAFELANLNGRLGTHDEAMIASIADESDPSYSRFLANGQLPGGMTLVPSSLKEEYPPRVWAQAEATWNSLGPAEQEARRAEQRRLQEEVRNWSPPISFGDLFWPFDALWISLAMITAYTIGVGTYGTHD